MKENNAKERITKMGSIGDVKNMSLYKKRIYYMRIISICIGIAAIIISIIAMLK